MRLRASHAQPWQRDVNLRIENAATQWVGRGRGSPYDALSRFYDSVLGDGDGDDPPDLPLRMAQVLAEGTGARWTQVWLMVDDVPGPNGLAFSPDEKKLYVVASRAEPNRTLVVYDVLNGGTKLGKGNSVLPAILQI